MSLHRLTAGAGYQYLLKHTASGDCDRTGRSPLTAYYAESGNPPGRWLGTGLAGLDGGKGLPEGTRITEEAMGRLFGQGCDPVTGAPLGRAYPHFASPAERIAAATAALPPLMGALERQAAIETIKRVELAKPSRTAIAGFDLTFTVPKSASVLWALADAPTQQAVFEAHRDAVEQSLDFLERTALFTRTGTGSCAQVTTRGLIAASFDHWDTRTGDPNLHSHVVVANKVQGPDGAWRTVDSRALHHAVVSISEIYDNLLADELARRLPVAWGWRTRGPRRSPAFEVTGIGDRLLATFSTRSTQIDAAMTTAVAEFVSAHGRGPNRVEVVRLRQQVTRATRPDKHVRPLGDLLTTWRHRGAEATGCSPEELVGAALHASHVRALTSAQVSDDVVARLGLDVIEQVLNRRSTWTRSNLLAEAARTTRGLRMASAEDRHALHSRLVDAAVERCVSLAAPEVFTVPDGYHRPDGTSVFTRVGENRYTDLRILDAETRLLNATTDDDAPSARLTDVRDTLAAPVQRSQDRGPVTLAPDQAGAVRSIATSGRRIDVLVGPAGTGKTTTLLALRHAWEASQGRGSVIGLAPSATAAAELADALDIDCENTAKWLHESTGPGHERRVERLAALTDAHAALNAHADPMTARSLDRQLTALHQQDQAWSLHPGQLVIVDEASLAGTLALDNLAAQATAAGAKLVLVGDHAQLSAVDAGGAFNLLAERGRPTVLSSLWRFSHAWEADATRHLRAGRTAALDAYWDHDRIAAGPGEAMLEDAYSSWQASETEGHAAILLAADSRTVDALNLRAHSDRVTDGLVDPAGLITEGGTTIARGDRILTRQNARQLTAGDGGHVRNGDLWDVVNVHPDGSITAARTTRRAAATQRDAQVVAVLPPDYVTQHVDLGYATTTHRAQGITVDHAHVLAAPGMTRENLYVAMTRGRHVNRTYVAVDGVDPACDGLPDTHRAADAREILERILATPGAELSATQTIAHALADATSRERLEPIRATLAADAATRRWRRELPTCGLTDEQVTQLWASTDRSRLVTALRAGEAAGHTMQQVVTRLARSDDGARHGPTDSEAPAAGLVDRIESWLDAHTDPDQAMPGGPARREPIDPTDPAASALAQIDELLAPQCDQATAWSTADRPGWLPPRAEHPGAGSDEQPWCDEALEPARHGAIPKEVVSAARTRPAGPRALFDQRDPVDPPSAGRSIDR